MLKRVVCTVAVVLVAVVSSSQAQRKFPPDSLVNVKVFDQNTPVMNVIGQMRNFAGALGVRCQYCHVGEEGQPLEKFDFPSDEKRTKKTARIMMKVVEDVNRRFTEIPERPTPNVEVTCVTCHRGVPRPAQLVDLITQFATTNGADSAQRAYRSLREKFYGRSSYDFGEGTLNTVAGRLARAGQFDAAMNMLALNQEFFASASSIPFNRGEVRLAKGDTAGALGEYRKAADMDGNQQAQQRLKTLLAK